MNNDQTKQIADQTEISVSESPINVPKRVSRFHLPDVRLFKNKKVIGVLFILVLLVLTVSGYIFFAKDKNSYSVAVSKLKQARESYARGDLQTTEKNLYKSLSAYPNNPEGLAALIVTIAIQGNQTGTENQAYEKGKQYVEYGLKYFPNNVSVLLSSGYLYETSGQYETALKYYQKAIEIDPDNSKAIFRKGHVLEFLGKRNEANMEYDKAYSLNSEDPYTLIAIGNRLVSEGKIEEAFETYKRAADNPKAPNSVRSEALTDASIVRTSQIIHMEEAASLAKAAVDADSKFSPALAQYANVMFLNGDAKTAGEYIGRAIQANPRISKNYNLAAQMLRYNKRYGDAINYHKEAISRVANDNTLLGPAQKDGAKAFYTYELAKTYDISGLKVDIIPFLSTAIQTNSNLKTTLRSDFEKYGFFKTLGTDQRFVNLLN